MEKRKRGSRERAEETASRNEGARETIQEEHNLSENDAAASRGQTEGFIFDQWQQEVLDASGNLLLCTGRQVGKTTTLAIKAARYMMQHKNSRIIVVSLTEDQAQLIIIMILTFFEKNYKTWLKRPYTKNITKNKIVLNNGSQVLSRPVGNTGDAVRGFTGDVLIIDEASRMPEQVWTSAKPTLLTTGGELWICSTPFGRKGYFYDCWENKNNRFKVFHISSEEVIKNRPISASWTEKKREAALQFLDDEKRDMSELLYAQEYLGKFIDELRQLFPDEMIEACQTLKRPSTLNKRFADYFLGCDIARLGDDETTYEILEKLPEVERLRQVESIIKKKQPLTKTHDDILHLDRTYDFKEIGIDAGSGALGVGLLDFLLRSEVKRKVVALNNLQRQLDASGTRTRGLLKEDMYFNLRSLMERGVIELLDDYEVFLSLKSVQYEYVIKPGQPSKIRIFGNYTHIVEGLVRAAWLAFQKNINTGLYWI